MFIRFVCPNCGTRSKAPPERAGSVGKCITCGSLVRVPAAETARLQANASSSSGVMLNPVQLSNSGSNSSSASDSFSGSGSPHSSRLGLPLSGESVQAGGMPLVKYVQLLRQSQLIEPEILEKHLAQLVAARQPGQTEVEQLSSGLIAVHQLTEWQHARLLEGLFNGFFLGRYKLLRELGAGGMGSVYLAEHVLMNRRVAVKVLHGNRAANPAQLARFRRECQCLAALDHPNVVRVHDFDQSGDWYYMIMELIEGPNLQDLVEQFGPLPYASAVQFITQAASGLYYAHEKGLVHRDVKPANLLVNRKGVVKLSDLGLARVVDQEGPSMTVDEGGVLGTTDFLAPEQALDSSSVDSHADIYSLGCTLYFLLVGLPPFPNGSMAQRLLMHQIKPAPRLKAGRADAPDRLQEICDRMMNKQPAERPNAAQVRQWLAHWVALNPQLARATLDLSQAKCFAQSTGSETLAGTTHTRG